MKPERKEAWTRTPCDPGGSPASRQFIQPMFSPQEYWWAGSISSWPTTAPAQTSPRRTMPNLVRILTTTSLQARRQTDGKHPYAMTDGQRGFGEQGPAFDASPADILCGPR